MWCVPPLWCINAGHDTGALDADDHCIAQPIRTTDVILRFDLAFL